VRPDKRIVILEPEADILAGPYKQELRDEARRHLGERGVEFVLGQLLAAEPQRPPVMFGPVRLADGSIEVNSQLQVTGHANVFALGDVAAADLKTAGRAGREADVVVANIRALVEGGELQACEPSPPAIVMPLGPSGGVSELPGQDEIAGAEKTAAIKGEHMFVDAYRERFGLAAPFPSE
jgi:NADH dehydrogenase FAD-containing subunit